MEKQNSEDLLLNILPPTIVERINAGEELIADRFDEVSVLFSDLVGFTEISGNLGAGELMEQGQSIDFCPSFCVETFVPNDLKSYFNQRRRWERGTTKVLWNKRSFYLGLFTRLRLLALFTVIHLLIYIGLVTALALMSIGTMDWRNFGLVLVGSATWWLLVSVLKGMVIKLKRPPFQFWRYCVCAVLNGGLWLFVTTPARLTGFTEGIIDILSGGGLSAYQSHKLERHTWLGAAPNNIRSNIAHEDPAS